MGQSEECGRTDMQRCQTSHPAVEIKSLSPGNIHGRCTLNLGLFDDLPAEGKDDEQSGCCEVGAHDEYNMH